MSTDAHRSTVMKAMSFAAQHDIDILVANEKGSIMRSAVKAFLPLVSYCICILIFVMQQQGADAVGQNILNAAIIAGVNTDQRFQEVLIRDVFFNSVKVSCTI